MAILFLPFLFHFLLLHSIILLARTVKRINTRVESKSLHFPSQYTIFAAENPRIRILTDQKNIISLPEAGKNTIISHFSSLHIILQPLPFHFYYYVLSSTFLFWFLINKFFISSISDFLVQSVWHYFIKQTVTYRTSSVSYTHLTLPTIYSV